MNNIDDILKSLGIVNYSVRDDGSIVVRQDVHWEGKDLESIPVKFYSIDGDFNLKGNKLKNLENFPQFITGTATVSYNKLESLEGIPKGAIMLGLVADNNFLTSLKGAPERTETFSIDNNSSLRSLEHASTAKRVFVRGLANVPTHEIVIYTRCITIGTWDSTKDMKDNFKILIRKDASQLEDPVFHANVSPILDLTKDDLKGTLVGVKFGI